MVILTNNIPIKFHSFDGVYFSFVKCLRVSFTLACNSRLNDIGAHNHCWNVHVQLMRILSMDMLYPHTVSSPIKPLKGISL